MSKVMNINQVGTATPSGDHETVDANHIRELRAQIAAGTYLTDEKLDIAIDHLLAELRKPVRVRAAG